jgi:hypothetical protein
MVRKSVFLVLSVTLLSLTVFATHKNQEKTGQTTKDGFPVVVNYNRTIEQLVKAGKYDWSNPDITSKNFPSNKKGNAQVSIQLVHFDRTMTSDEVLKELDKQGLRPATLPELLAFGAKYPDKQREFPIVALGSVWRSRGGDRDLLGMLLQWSPTPEDGGVLRVEPRAQPARSYVSPAQQVSLLPRSDLCRLEPLPRNCSS